MHMPLPNPIYLLCILISILVPTVAFAGSADPSSQTFSALTDPLQLDSRHFQLLDLNSGINSTEINTADFLLASADSDAPAPSQKEDRRDRIFYPGDTERPKPLLRKL